MSTWPSGAIARATVNGEPNVLAMRANDGHWYSQHGLNWRDEQVTDARPLVVLDPAERPNLMFPVAAMGRPDRPRARGRCRMNRLLAILARSWRAFTAPVELDDTDRAW